MTLHGVLIFFYGLIGLLTLIGIIVPLSIFGKRRLVAVGVFIATWLCHPLIEATRTTAEKQKDAATLAAKVTKEVEPSPDTGPSNVELIVMAEDAVKERLKDPSSAKFKGTHVSSSSGVRLVCGQVNAKNGFGGYKGYEGYVTNGLPKYTFMQSEVKDFGTLWKRSCSES